MIKETFLCKQANELDLVDFLQSLGHQPTKIRGNDYWYLSPLRQEKTASFKVNQKGNVWYDHGMGKGGNLVDLGVLFYGCTVKEFLQKLVGNPALNFSFHPHHSPVKCLPDAGGKGLIVIAAYPIGSQAFCRYLSGRNIDLELAKQYLKEVSFELHGKRYTALGFENNSGGFELRNQHFKGSSSPKDVTLIGKEAEHISVFEGCFSFLSYLSLDLKTKAESGMHLPEGHTNFLVLNSLSFLEKSRSVVEKHASIHLFLDRDAAGLKATQQALEWSPKYENKSSLYSGYKDMNDFLIGQQKTEQRQSRRKGMHL